MQITHAYRRGYFEPLGNVFEYTRIVRYVLFLPAEAVVERAVMYQFDKNARFAPHFEPRFAINKGCWRTIDETDHRKTSTFEITFLRVEQVKRALNE